MTSLRLWIVVAVAILSSFARPADVAAQWTQTVIDGSLGEASGVDVADVDGDGILDIVAVAAGADDVVWYKGPTWIRYTIDSSFEHAHAVLRAVDVDRDGDIDVVANNFDPGDVSWWRNNGNPTSTADWTEVPITRSFNFGTGMHVGDADGDGDLDVVSFKMSSTVYLWENDGTPSDPDWTGTIVDVGTLDVPRDAHIGDFDGDSIPEIIVTASSNNLVRRYSNATGTWVGTTILDSASFPADVKGADIDSDGDEDLILTALTGYDVLWLENVDNASSWVLHTIESNLGEPIQTAPADLDGDGWIDVAVTSRAAKQVAWYRNPGPPFTGSWTKDVVQSGVNRGFGVVAADISGDGLPDLVATADRDDDVLLFTNPNRVVSVNASGSLISEDGATVEVGARINQIEASDVVVVLNATGVTASSVDFANTSAVLTIPAGSLLSNTTMTLSAADDFSYDPDETLTVRVQSAGSITVNATPISIGIQDNDVEGTVLTFDMPAVTVDEDNGADPGPEARGTTVTIGVNLLAPIAVDVSVPIVVSGTATEGSDFEVTDSPVLIPAGATSVSMTVSVAYDLLDELDETVVLSFGALPNGYVGAFNTTATVTIVDNDSWPNVVTSNPYAWSAPSPASSSSSNAEHASAAIIAGRPAVAYYDATDKNLIFSISPSTDGSGTWSEYVVDAAGDTGLYPSLASVDGNPAIAYLDQSNEVLVFSRSGAADGSGSWNRQVVDSSSRTGWWPSLTIVNGNPAIAYYDQSVNDLSYATNSMADGSGSWARSKVAVTGDTGRYPSLAVVDGRPAIASYDATNQDLVYSINSASDASGSWSSTIVNATGFTGEYASMIQVDGRPAIAYFDASENDLVYSINSAKDGSGSWAGTVVNAVGDVGRAAAMSVVAGRPAVAYHDRGNGDLLVSFSTSADGLGTWLSTLVDSAFEPSYLLSRRFLFALGDGRPFVVYDSDTGGAPIRYSVGSPVGVTVSFATEAQSVPESASTATVTASLSAVSGKVVTVPVTFFGSAGTPADFNSLSASITIPAGSLSGALTLTIVDDETDEGDETISVAMGTPANATAGSVTTHTITIADNDDTPVAGFLLAAATVEEGAGTVNVTVLLDRPTDLGASIATMVSGTATLGTDYSNGTSLETITIPPGASNTTVTLNVTAPFDDALHELDETILLTMLSAVNATLGSANATTVTITDNDPAPTVSLTETASTVNETSTAINVTVALSAVSGLDVTLPFTTTTTGTAGSDYALNTTSPVVIPAGSSNATITLTVIDDGLSEMTETVNVTLGAPTGGTLGANTTFTLTILDNDFDFGDAPDTYGTLLASDGARHAAIGPRLGALVDAEPDGVPTANATGDDAAYSDDEDGVRFSPFVVSTTVATSGSATVNVSGVTGTAYLNVWLDYRDGSNALTGAGDGDFSDLNEHIVKDQAVADGVVTVPVTLPAGITPGTTIARFRITTATGSGPTGYAADGEVEDYAVTFTNATGVAVTVTSEEVPANRLVIDGGAVCIADDLSNLFCAPPDYYGSLAFTGGSSDDTFTIDMTGGNPIPAGGFTFDGGAGSDTIVLVGGTQDTVTQTFVTGSDGTIDVDGRVVTYTGLEPIIDNLVANHRVFTFTGGTETITLTPDGDGALNNGVSWIDSDKGESVSFANPAISLTINGGTGVDTMNISALDTVIPGTFTTFTVNGGDGADVIRVAPSAAYSVTVTGGDPSNICPGDVFDLMGGTLSGTLTSGNGTAAFSSGEQAVTYSGIGVIFDALADLAVSSIVPSASNLYPGDQTRVSVTVVNSGPSDASCLSATVDLSQFLNIASPPNAAPVASQGSYAFPTWTIGSLAVNGSATLTLEGVIDTQLGGDLPLNVTVTTQADDTNATNNSLVSPLAVGVPFEFPAKAHINSALWTTLPTGLERMIVGLFQGSPGINGAVWCRIPAPDGVVFTPEGMPVTYKTCSVGLPAASDGTALPLHVNDLWEDTDGAQAGRIWLTTWGWNGLYYSDDDGENWTAAEPNLGAASPGTTGWVNVYAITEDAVDGILYISANNGLVFRSLNAGVSWQQVASLPQGAAETPWSLESHPTQAGTLYAGTMGRGVFVSTDYGLTWNETPGNGTLMTVGIDADYIFDLEFAVSGGSTYLYAATSRGVWVQETSAGTPVWTNLDASLQVPIQNESGTTILATPEIRTLEFGADTDGDGEGDLYASSWGFGVFKLAQPITKAGGSGAGFQQLALKGMEVTSISISPAGVIFAFTSDGGVHALDPTVITATAIDYPMPEGAIPTDYVLEQNYPNPFNPVTTIVYGLPAAEHVRLAVYDILGREVRLLIDQTMQAGRHQVTFEARDLPSGLYVYRLETAAMQARMLTLVK